MVVKGGYSPDVRVRAGIPLRLRFDRQESGDCTARVIFADFALARSLPANATTVVELTPIATRALRLRLRDEHGPRHPCGGGFRGHSRAAPARPDTGSA